MRVWERKGKTAEVWRGQREPEHNVSVSLLTEPAPPGNHHTRGWLCPAEVISGRNKGGRDPVMMVPWLVLGKVPVLGRKVDTSGVEREQGQ